MANYKSFSGDAYNVFGALLFLGYIAAALYFSARFGAILKNQWASSSSRGLKRNGSSRLVVVSAVLCLLSFTVLSYNMISFLVLSCKDWTIRHSVAASWLQQPTLLWNWMSHATLFEDFAQALVATPERTLVTQFALLQTFWLLSRIYTDANISNEELAVLVPLSQILPVSYTFNLYTLLMALKAQVKVSDAVKPRPQGKEREKPSRIHETLGAVYAGLINLISSFTSTAYFMAVVLLVRAMLLVPLLTKRQGKASSPWPLYAATAAILISGVFQVSNAEGGGLGRVAQAFTDHPAVRAVGQDAIIALASHLLYITL